MSLGDIHVVHYEKVLRNRVDELSKILNFFGLEIDQKRMSCVEYCENDMYKRKETFCTSMHYCKSLDMKGFHMTATANLNICN